MMPEQGSVAVLGCGNMGRMLAKCAKIAQAERAARGLPRSAVVAWSRDPAKVASLLGVGGGPADGIIAAGSAAEAVRGAAIVLLCVSPGACAEVIAQVADGLAPGTQLVSVAADLPLRLLESIANCKVSRIMPTVCAEAGLGITLYAPGSRVGAEDEGALAGALGPALALERVREADIDALAALTSCGPGIFAAMLAEVLRAFRAAHPATAGATAYRAITSSLEGLVALAKRDPEGFEGIYRRVATKGGTTEAGAAPLREGLPELLARSYAAMDARHAERAARIERDIGGRGGTR